MIISAEKLLMTHGEYEDIDLLKIQSWLDSIEQIIRSYTNNNFQNRNVRFIAESSGNQLKGSFSFLRPGDTVQISQSKVNDGLYVVQEITEGGLTLYRGSGSGIMFNSLELFDVPYNKITKIEYPEDVVQCAVDLFEWKANFGSKVGIKSESETLSRHSESVTYEDSSSLYMGYPIGILKGLNHYRKVRC